MSRAWNTLRDNKHMKLPEVSFLLFLVSTALIMWVIGMSYALQ